METFIHTWLYPRKIRLNRWLYSKNTLIELLFILSTGKDTFGKYCIFITILKYSRNPKYSTNSYKFIQIWKHNYWTIEVTQALWTLALAFCTGDTRIWPTGKSTANEWLHLFNYAIALSNHNWISNCRLKLS